MQFIKRFKSVALALALGLGAISMPASAASTASGTVTLVSFGSGNLLLEFNGDATVSYIAMENPPAGCSAYAQE